MSIRVGINGYGRIGRNVLRALYESGRQDEISIVAINDIGDLEVSAHLTRYDSAHGPFDLSVEADGDSMTVGDDRIRFTACRNPADIPWKESEVDVVIESTGLFASREKSQGHLEAGAPRVLISAPAGKDVDATVVYGVNHDQLGPDHVVVSNASCTTNCLAPLAKVLMESVGIESGIMTTIHSYTNDQVLTDVAHSDLRRARSATQSMIPTATGAARAVGLVLPELDGRLDGFAIRVPTINVSVVDLSFVASRETNAEEVNAAVRAAAEGPLKGVLAYCEDPLVSIDFNHSPASSSLDASLTKVLPGNLVKVLSWYDNEWGFSNRMLDVIAAWMRASA
ncbi:MAG: type I glyceraldehyde-3-phosphate dehydrogenase [Gammaproteobacteria bacterium]|nr:type I glyceraldehyde-3-phosphate dehydrogenase [Gammaproteobacteria bacterium]